MYWAEIYNPGSCPERLRVESCTFCPLFPYDSSKSGVESVECSAWSAHQQSLCITCKDRAVLPASVMLWSHTFMLVRREESCLIPLTHVHICKEKSRTKCTRFFFFPHPVECRSSFKEQCRAWSGNGNRWSCVDSLLFFPCQINPEAVRGDFSSLEAETKHLRAQLNDSLKELHQKELRIQQLNSKVYKLCFLLAEFGLRNVGKWAGFSGARGGGTGLSVCVGIHQRYTESVVVRRDFWR